MRPVVVAPLSRPLLRRLRGLPVVVRVDAPDRAEEAAALVAECGAELTAVLVEAGGNLVDLAVDGLPATVPLAVRLDALGPVRRLAPRLDALRHRNTRFYLPCRTREQAVDVRVLASLGLPVAADLAAPGNADWDALLELAVYALYNSVAHADIDPFFFLGRRYDPNQLPLDPRAPWFAAPGNFVWADESGALSSPRFDGGFDSFPLTIEELGGSAAEDKLSELHDGWREFFIAPHPCQSCEGLRVCLGRFSAEAGPGCRALMAEALAGAERVAGARRSRVEPWQP